MNTFINIFQINEVQTVNVWCIKIRTKDSSKTLLRLVGILMHQTLFDALKLFLYWFALKLRHKTIYYILKFWESASRFYFKACCLLQAQAVNVSRVSQKLLRTEPHVVENRGITMAPLFLRLTSWKTHPHSI